jgi:hypothetical protein
MTVRSAYESQLSRQAAQFVITLPRRQQRLVLDLADQIARQPFGVGDYQTEDLSGRTVENVLLDAYVFTYWVDHAVREVRITEIVRT